MLQMRNNITKQYKFSNIAKNDKMYCYYYIMNTPLQNLTHWVSRASNFNLITYQAYMIFIT